MAFTEFYMQPTGSNLNAGSTNADTAAFTYASGNWVQSTGVFTLASGNPQSDGVQVGDWASVYADGSSDTVFVGKVSAVDSTTITVGITDATKIGSVPSNGTGNRTLKIGGAWADFDGLLASAVLGTVSTLDFAWRLNIKAATYTTGGSSRLWRVAGNGVPVEVRGYKTSLGDMDDKPAVDLVAGTDIPLISSTGGGRWTFTAAYVTVRNLSFLTTATSNPTVTINTFGSLLLNCKIENQTAHASAAALSTGAAFFGAVSCWCKATATASRVVHLTAGTVLFGVYAQGGQACYEHNSSSAISRIFNCIAIDAVNDGFLNTNNTATIVGCTIHNCGRDGIRLVHSGAALVLVNCIFSECVGVGVNNVNATNTANFVRVNNLFYDCGTDEDGFGDAASIWPVSDSNSPFVDAGAGDFTPTSDSAAIAAAAPGLFLGTALRSYLDIGAVQHQGGGGGGVHSPLRSSLIRGVA